MQKMLLSRNANNNYWFMLQSRTSAAQLEYIPLAFSNIQDSDIEVEKYVDEKYVVIYSNDSIKQKVEINFRTLKEEQEYENAYDEYCDKRYDDMPKVVLGLDDYYKLLDQWNKIVREKPNYIMLTLDESGPLDKVTIEPKEALLDKDKLDIKHEYAQYIRRLKAERIYQSDHPYQDDFWRGSEDSFFETDLEPYYDRDRGFIPRRVYTKKELGLELKSRVLKKEYYPLLGHWIIVVRRNDIVDDYNERLENIFFELGWMKSDPDRVPSYEKLNEIADLIIAGRDNEIDFKYYD